MRRLPVLATFALAGALTLSACTNAVRRAAPAETAPARASAAPSYDVVQDRQGRRHRRDAARRLRRHAHRRRQPPVRAGRVLRRRRRPDPHRVRRRPRQGARPGPRARRSRSRTPSSPRSSPASAPSTTPASRPSPSTPERVAEVDMISYISAGSTYSVQAGNPQGPRPGRPVRHDHRRADRHRPGRGHRPALRGLPGHGRRRRSRSLRYNSQADVTTNLVGGKIDVMYADSPVGQYAAVQTQGKVEQLGDVTDTAPQGIVVAKDDPELTAALQAAMQHLIDEGVWQDILDTWGVCRRRGDRRAQPGGLMSHSPDRTDRARAHPRPPGAPARPAGLRRRRRGARRHGGQRAGDQPELPLGPRLALRPRRHRRSRASAGPCC